MSNVIPLRPTAPKPAPVDEPVTITIHDSLAASVRTAAMYQSKSPENFLYEIIALAFPEARAG